MNKLYNILILEDNPADAELIELQLKKVDLELKTMVISTKNELFHVFDQSIINLVISDFGLQNFDGTEALKIVKSINPEIPFILVSGFLELNTAIELMKNGADDYIVKDELERLVPAVKKLIKTSDELKNTRKRLEAAYRLADIGHWQIDLTTDTLFWSTEVKNIFEVDNNYTPNFEKAINFYDENDHRNHIQEVFKRAINRGQEYEIEALVITAKGNKRWVRTNGKPIFENGICVQVYGSIQDITEEKEAELALRESQKMLQDIFEHSTNLFYKHDTNFNLTYVSPQSEYFLGCSPEEAKKKWTAFITDHPANEEGIENTNKAIETGETQPPYNLELERTDGSRIWVRVNETPVIEDGKTVAIVGSLTDITELENKRNQLEEAQKLGQIGNWDYDVKTGEINWSGTLFDIYGRNPALGPPDFDRLVNYYEDRDFFVKSVQRAVELAIPYAYDIEIISENGVKKHIHQEGIPQLNDEGEVFALHGIVQDVTERKNFIERIKNKRQRLEESQHLGLIGDWDYDLETGEVTWSKMLFEIFERDPSLGAPDYERNIEYYFDQKEFFKKSITRAADEGIPYSYDIKIRTEKGNIKFVHLEGIPTLNEDEEVTKLHGIVQDITERKEFEIRLDAAIIGADLGVWELNVKTGEYQTNDRYWELLGYTKEEFTFSFDFFLSLLHPEDKHKPADVMKRIEAGGKNQIDITIRLLTKSGKYKWFQTRGRVVEFAQDGSTDRIIGTILDITEEVEREKELEQERDRLLIAQRIGLIGDWLYDLKTQKITWSDTLFEIYERDTHLGAPSVEQQLKYYPENEDLFLSKVQEAAEGVPYSIDLEMRTEKENRKYVHLEGVPIEDDAGNVIEVHGVAQDITKAKEAEIELELERDRLVEAQRIGSIGDYTMDLQTEEIFWSEQMYEIYEREPDKSPLSTSELLNSFMEDTEEIEMLIHDALENRSNFEYDVRIQTDKGNEKFIHAEGYPILNQQGEPIRIQGIVQDITERKRSELELEYKQRQIESVSSNINGLFLRYVLKEDGTDELEYVSSGVKNVHEISENEALQNVDKIWGQILPEYEQKLRESIMESAKNMTPWREEFQIKTPSGKFKWLKSLGIPQKRANGDIVWDTFTHDVTDLFETEIELSETLKLSDAILETLPGHFFRIDMDTNLVQWNANAENYYNKCSVNLEGKKLSELFDDSEKEKIETFVKKIGKEDSDHIEVEHSFQSTVYSFYLNGKMLETESGAFIILIAIDITDRKKAELYNEALVQEIHHRVKNNLAIITGLLELQLTEMDDDKRER